MKSKGFVLYEGPSMLTNEPIVAIATLRSANTKTGDMVQTWIMRSDMAPLQALDERADGAICGGCPLRKSIGGSCYVNVAWAPQGIWKAWQRGNYPKATDKHLAMLNGRKVRLGAYGDPAAVPYEVWERVTAEANAYTGYTHQIGHKRFDHRILNYCMVSADTPKAALKAQSLGFRTFRVKVAGAPMLPGEVECLADSDGLTCEECGLCRGKNTPAPSVVIDVHGSLKGRFTAKYAGAHA